MTKRGCLSRKSEKGMTLVEVLAAVVILSVIMGTVLAVYSQSRATSVRDDERLKALYLAQTVLERWTALPENNYAALNHELKNASDNPNAVVVRDLTNETLRTIWNGLNSQGFTPRIRFQYLNHTVDDPVRVTVTVASQNDISVSLEGLVVPAGETQSGRG